MHTLFLAFLTALILSFLSIPSIVRISKVKHLFDEPDSRKCHKSRVPTLGGVAIFGAMIFSLTFWSDQELIRELQYILASLMILFYVGVKDDLLNIRAYKKLIVQIVASFIIVHYAGIRLYSFFGLFGIHDLDVFSSYAISIFTITSLTNAFNLIDGIDGLAGSIGILVSLIFGVWFSCVHSYQYAILSFTMMGALIGFIYYNWSPAKIFMGDTGSLIVGFVSAILAIKFIEINRHMDREADFKVISVPVVTISILVIPIFDTIRIFSVRILKGRSPFAPDRNHIHHLLLDRGMTHSQTVLTLLGVNIGLIVLSYFLQGRIVGEILLLVVAAIPCLLTLLLVKLKH
ncbi:glycosyltransferase family 4 protein [Peredibacter sp. HCB2-198]|uniref:glycosyltransferase family 4 protein n=1 Tax=Peredibacter sp. HCB2-198 TaxID=3383025 RepID=UPI0038B4F399